MKKNISLVLLVFVLLLSGCSKIATMLNFTISHQTNMQLNSYSYLNTPFEVPTPDITTNSSEEFENNNTNANLVKDVKLKELKLTVTSPAGKTFSFLKNIHIYISSDGSEEIELAHLDNINSGVSEITLITTEANLDSFIKASSYKLRTQIETRETVTQTVDIQVDLKFNVTANI